MTSKWNKAKLPIIAMSVFFGIVTMHACPFFGGNHIAHTILLYLLLVPVALAGTWFRWAGGASAAILTGAAAIGFAARSGGQLMDPADSANAAMAGAFLYALLVLAAGCFAAYAADKFRSEQQKVSEALANQEKEQAAIKTRLSELEGADEELRRGERLRVLGELSGELAHEIQNPLASIKGTAEILSDRCQGKCGTGEFIEILMSEIKRLRSVLDRFLDFARNQDTESPVCNALAAFDDVIRLMKHQMDKHHIRLHLNAPSGACIVRISDEQMKQVFVNLVLNAVQAMPEGGEMHADFLQNDQDLTVSIRDTGQGIKDKDRERIFSPFFTTKRGGTGLGLSIVWRILTKHGGSIKLASKAECPQGACFSICLPRGQEGEMVVSKATA